MTVKTFTQPDYADVAQTGSIYPTNIDKAIAVHHRMAGAFAPHAQSTPNMTVRVDAGALAGSGAPVEVAAQSTGTIVAPVTNPRIDRIVIDASTGAVAVIAGTEAGSPVAPVIPNGYLPIAQVALATSTAAITNALITDERVSAAASNGGGSAGPYTFFTAQ